MVTPNDAIRQLEADDLAGAEKTCLELLAADPTDEFTSFLLAVARSCQGRPEEAIHTLTELANRPDPEPPHVFHFARTQAQLGFIDEALASLDRIAAVFPPAREFRDELTSGPYFGFMQGHHAPERHAYLSAAIGSKAQGSGPLRLLEVGSFMGSSAYTLACAVARLTDRPAQLLCVDAWGAGSLDEYDTKMKDYLRQGGAFSAFKHNITLFPPQVQVEYIRGCSDDILPALDRRFDLIYLDGAHTYDGVVRDIGLCRDLLGEDGILCGDDLELQLHECDQDMARAMCRAVWAVDPATGRDFHPGVTLAVAEHFGPVANYHGFWAVQRRGDGWQGLSLAGMRGIMPRHWPPSHQRRIAEVIGRDGVLAELV